MVLVAVATDLSNSQCWDRHSFLLAGAALDILDPYKLSPRERLAKNGARHFRSMAAGMVLEKET